MKTNPILSNPEFQRNLWQELTSHRLIGGVAVLGILAWLVYATSASNSFYWVSYGIIFIWGIKSASESVQEELQHGTWDYQRMSSISPFKFTWGKLLGSTSYTWYLATISFVIYISLGHYFETSFNILLRNYFVLVLCGLFGQYIAMVLSLNAIQFGRDKNYSFRYFISALIISSAFAFMLTHTSDRQVYWYNVNFNAYSFYLIFVTVLLGWSILGSYRLIRTEFQYKNLPLVWLGFCLFWIGYITGFDGLNLGQILPPSFTRESPSSEPYTKIYLAFGMATILLYISLFSEKYQIFSYRKIIYLIQQQKYLDGLCALPRWVIAGICYITLYIGMVLFGNLEIALNKNISDIIDHVSKTPELVFHGYIFGTTALLLAIRDILLVHFFYFSANPKRAALTSILYLGLLYFVLPLLFSAIGLKNLNSMLLISYNEVGIIGWVGLLTQIGLLFWLVLNRFRRI